MSKFFMYGTDLHELEQLMMLVPNFMPRRSGVIVVKTVEDKKEPLRCQDCGYPISDCCNDTPCIYFAERLAAGLITYFEILENHFKDCGSIRLKRRLDFLVSNFDGEIFLNPIHRSRFYTVCRLQDIPIEDRYPSYLATLFLLTAGNKLWCAAKEDIYLDSFDFKKMHLNGMNTDGYAIFQTARTIYTDREYIKQDEIADKTLITERTFKVIINAMLLSKYGAAMFQIKC
jgi:hypothetical protein